MESSKQYKLGKTDENANLVNLEVILCAQEEKFTFKNSYIEGDQSKNNPEKRSWKFSRLVVSNGATVLPITFFGDPHTEEVQLLQEKYSMERDKIEDIIEKKDVLRIILQALCK